MNILIVDDNPTNLKLLRAILEAHGHSVVAAQDGEEALAVLDRHPVSAIISDLLMPKMDGYRLCQEVRSSEKHGQLPFVVYTATYTSPADERFCLDLGADKYLRKPATARELISALEDALAMPHREPGADIIEPDVLKEYSQRLIDKLEEKNIEVEQKSEEIARANTQLNNFLAESPVILYALRINGDEVEPYMVSPNIARILGYEPGEATSVEWWLASLHPDDLELAKQIAAATFSAGLSRTQYRIRAKNGTYHWFEDSKRLIRDESGQPAEMIGVWTDITERRAAELALQEALAETERKVDERTAALAKSNEELRSAKDSADSANRSKSEFLSRMSHELRTPMNSILGFGQLLEFSNLDAGQQDSVDHILKAGRHLLMLINEVLEISRIEAGSLALSLEPVEVADAVEECFALMQPAAKDRNVTLKSAGRQSILLSADRQRLSQVLLNLVSNAIKYNVRGGTVTIKIGTQNGGFGTIEVADTGVGIPAAMIEKLFTPFERLAAQATGVEGTGLGLALSRSLVEAMGGTLTVKSDHGVGSAFQVRLAIAKAVATKRDATLPSAFDPAVWAGLAGRLLVIEDNFMNTQLLSRMFAEYPLIELVSAMKGRLGLELAKDRPPDAILLDLHLPDMNGRDVLSELRANPSLRHIPVIIVTADAFSDNSQSLLRAGAFRYLTKPFVLNELISAVADALRRRSDR